MRLNMSDIGRLAQSRAPEARADIAGKVASTLTTGAFNEKESSIAVEILRTLVRDVEVRVRKSIAMHLGDAHSVPHDLVMHLAQDVPDVSVPLLRYSYALSEDDLVEIVRSTREVAKLMAVASRDSISAHLTEALLDTKVQEVMKTVLANQGAVVQDQHLLSRWEMIAGEKSLLEVLVKRGGLSLTVAEKLYAVASEEMKPQLAATYRLPMIVVEEAAEDLREWATLNLASPDDPAAVFSDSDLGNLIEHLYGKNRLTYSLVMRSLCIGDMNFFEAALAKLAGLPRANTRLLLFDSGEMGFKALYERARLPEGFYEAIRTLLRISLEETGYGRFRQKDFRHRVIVRIESAGYDRTVENMQYLLTIIGGKIAKSETIH